MDIGNFHKEVPTWDNGNWTETIFDSRDEFKEFVFSCFKEPGKYELDDTSKLFNEQARLFHKNGYYCNAPFKTKDFFNYWNTEKKKCTEGVIFKNGNKVWYLPREYYMWINFLPIYDKMKKDFDFPLVWDVQIHMSLYEQLAELNYKHAVIVKKRQIASSYFHCAKLLNKFWFDAGSVLKIGASLKKYVNNEGSWKYLEEYKNFLNSNTAWYRPLNPSKEGNWQQKVEINDNGRIITKGLKSTLLMTSFEKSETSGVGGPCHRLGTKIIMSNGRMKSIEDIKTGEFILGIDNKPKKVLKVFSGESSMYEVIPIRGRSFYATGNHILSLYTNDQKVNGDIERNVKVSEWDNLTPYQKRRWVQKRNDNIIEFDKETDCTLDPYFLGLWLGDGYREKVGLIINKTEDPEILDYCIELGKKINWPFNYHRKEKDRYNVEIYSCYYNISEDFIDGPLTKEFIKYNLFYNKHIPEEYLYGSIDVRKQLLAGIIDTDGHYLSNKYRFEISQKNDILFNQIVFLARSLGAIVHTRKTPSKEHIVNGRKIKFSETNCCAISFKDPSIIPTKLKRKQCCKGKYKSINTSPIKEIKLVNNGAIEKYAGIEVEDNHYFLEDFTITHNCSYFFHEEAGIAPKMDKTYIYLKSALEMGDITTGTFIAAGSVGELKDCDPLKEFILNPEANGFYGIETDLLDEKKSKGIRGLFIPEQWGMPPYIDNYGNSQVEEALKALDTRFKKLKEDKDPAAYQLEISQHPRNIQEAFAYRDVSIFPTNLIENQKILIEDKRYPYEIVELSEKADGTITVKQGNRSPINQWPVKKDLEDKRGAIQVWERPDNDIVFNEYICSIDPVKAGKTTTSDSLNSLYVYKRAMRVKRNTSAGEENYVEGDKIVCAWCGRYDNPKENHKQMELIIKWYKCKAIVEANVTDFINYMMSENLAQRYLVKKNEMLFLKEYNLNAQTFQEYGWKNTNSIFKEIMLPMLINWLNEVVDEDFDENGVSIKKYYGIRRIPDKMVLEEMAGYTPEKNVDRLIALTALVCYIKAQEANQIAPIRYESDDNLQKNRNLYKLTVNPFRNKSSVVSNGFKISPFSKNRW